jgi:hypothetical protein
MKKHPVASHCSLAGVCAAEDSGDFQTTAETNVWGAE